jgi:hypothetical protein
MESVMTLQQEIIPGAGREACGRCNEEIRRSVIFKSVFKEEPS